jgi:hypothetical protein
MRVEDPQGDAVRRPALTAGRAPGIGDADGYRRSDLLHVGGVSARLNRSYFFRCSLPDPRLRWCNALYFDRAGVTSSRPR